MVKEPKDDVDVTDPDDILDLHDDINYIIDWTDERKSSTAEDSDLVVSKDDTGKRSMISVDNNPPSKDKHSTCPILT